MAHNSKRIFPDAKVVYNDYDNYSLRLRNIDNTNRLLFSIREVIGIVKNGIRIEGSLRNKIIDLIERQDKSGYVDYITISSSLMFSSKYVLDLDSLKKEHFYNNVKSCDYECDPDEYLRGLDVVRVDYKVLYEQYKDVPGVVFTVDPPYLSTDTSTYHSDKYWKLRDYLDVLHVLVGTNYIFFTSDKSCLIELCEWFADNPNIGNPFAQSVLNTHRVTLNKTSGYNDMMLCKFID